jgi:hypothetical protein
MRRSILEKKTRLSTVNVIEFQEGDVVDLVSFANTPSGIIAARSLFKEIIIAAELEEGLTEAELSLGYIKRCTELGYYRNDEVDYKVFISVSRQGE